MPLVKIQNNAMGNFCTWKLHVLTRPHVYLVKLCGQGDTNNSGLKKNLAAKASKPVSIHKIITCHCYGICN